MQPRMPGRKKRLRSGWKLRAVKMAAVALAAGAVAFIVYCAMLSVRIDRRFSGRRWSMPSRVFADSTLLFPGQQIDPNELTGMLQDLGYRAVMHVPREKGQYRYADQNIEVYLHDLNLPARNRPGFPVKISLNEHTILSLAGLQDSTPLAVLELEPEEIKQFYGPERERRKLISLSAVPAHIAYAVLAAEDQNFYRHYGIDPRGILRALLVNFRSGRIRAGGSTITQQLAKCYFLSPERTLRRKFKELCIALVIEVLYEKNDILEIYLNEIYVGQKGSVSLNGVGEAADFYFRKPAEQLTPAEAAVIAGLIKAPNRYSPYADSSRCRSRRDQVLRAMSQNGWIDKAALQQGLQAPLAPAARREQQRQAGYFLDYLARQLSELYSADDLAALGLSIYTTLDTRVQTAAAAALEAGLQRLEADAPGAAAENLEGAVVVLQPRTGAILAMAGGRDYGRSQFNRITQARRQPGSAFKPIVYTTALDTLTPATLLSNAPRSFPTGDTVWEPRNFSEIEADRLPLRDALAKSVNRPAVDAALQAGLEEVIGVARSLGLTTPLNPFPSLALGAFEVIPLELARAYCSFAADGMLPYPLALRDVVDEQGTVLERRHMEIRRVLTPQKAFLMNALLKNVVTEGTARQLARYGIALPVAGKTGTTDDYRDAWFIGYTPDILALVWVGDDKGAPINATGATAALPIWAELMQRIPQHLSGSWFAPPPGIVVKTVCRQSGLLASKNKCPGARQEYFFQENCPAQVCREKHTRGLNTIMRGISDFIKQF
ncbi:MAG: PBP1A family penicillin-binding protein [Deltaproteobacteria bacterium]|nr:PBP1A family penicillin-binding protein [Deltaproteobacteria bacterium]